MFKNEVIEGAMAVAAAHNMTPAESDAYVGRCLASYRAGWKDAELEAKLINGVEGKKDRNEDEAIKLTHEFYEWARKQKIPGGCTITPYVVIIWMLDRILAKED